ncbi:hypothetical protein [Fusobacterium necrophorum]|uniref:hypothetical protein n=1 Tax=Fusobacterium necrophorum TaxID=859 RepID=UPI000AC849BE|nr:hypothetical protein [Fusobacterium necrophorum]
MNMKKRYWIFVAYLCIHQLGFSTSVQILQNGEEKGNTENPIILNHDYSKSDQEAKENEEKIKQWMEEGKIEKILYFLFSFFIRARKHWLRQELLSILKKQKMIKQ